jgi:hypothetical protein
MAAFWTRGRGLAIAAGLLAMAGSVAAGPRDGSHDFDFEFGAWRTQIRLMPHPLSGDGAWVDVIGASVVRPVWNGRANLGELDVGGGSTHIRGLSLRLYNPATGQWNISWANASDGTLTPPLIGEFRNGRGEFYNADTLNGRAIYARFIFSDFTANSFHLEQAFSPDGGKTWEPNWVATFLRDERDGG